MKIKINKLAKSTRLYRKLHKTIAIVLVFFILLISVTGALLAWKKELYLQPPTSKIAHNNKALVPLEIIEQNAIAYIDSLQLSTTINRIDYRPTKGIAKVSFEDHFTELQINCYTGKIVSAKQRTDTIIEMIHDGSILDFLIKNNTSAFKLFYSSIIALGLIFISVSGIILWINPKKIKKIKSTDNQ
ncbi:PepSY domain-containing protein [Cellulophaga sp. 20_2_10]|uniref:PepSY-associated TM helix domain-containing protein n=1 Tax=Cellulophaga sp. 20_2_10 TaxID=2942476 RepID=UPI00201B04AE|nr:PepSY-associated TM helix domain-containing protein [Cellulophaga sp. 20_2_10]MCL5244893.1 PepSY domain-containing protein [Cellulophaga sp. 20_2_10]